MIPICYDLFAVPCFIMTNHRLYIRARVCVRVSNGDSKLLFFVNCKLFLQSPAS